LPENRVSQQEKEIADLKIDFEHLEMIYTNSIECFRNQPAKKPCENCTILKNQVKCLLKTCAKFNKKLFLALKIVCLGKLDLVTILLSKKKAKKFSSFFSKSKPNDKRRKICGTLIVVVRDT